MSRAAADIGCLIETVQSSEDRNTRVFGTSLIKDGDRMGKGNALCNSVECLLSRLDVIAKAVDVVSGVSFLLSVAVILLTTCKIHPYLDAAWSLVSILHKVSQILSAYQCCVTNRLTET